jgi:riboflavin kinase/FMN adenylyltransferase
MHLLRSLQQWYAYLAAMPAGQPRPQHAVAIGMFDGLHRGHQAVLATALQAAQRLDVTPAVLTFDSHPQSLLCQNPPCLLASTDDRLTDLAETGFSRIFALPFDALMQQCPAETFIETLLVEALRVQSVTVGYDHRFGRDRAGNAAMLEAFGKRHGFEVQAVSAVQIPLPGGQLETVSSTLIRQYLRQGNVETAAHLLGRPYRLSGVVVPGAQRGRQLGFPTVNLDISPERLLPGRGVYAGWCAPSGPAHPASPWPCVMNIGTCPTFQPSGGTDNVPETPPLQLEAHLLANAAPQAIASMPTTGDTLTMTFTARLRDEQRFASAEALVAQITQDTQQARALLRLSLPPAPGVAA